MESFKSISTTSLRTYYGLLKNNEDRCSAFLSQLTNQKDPSYIDAQSQLEQVKKSLQVVSAELESRNDKLVYSIEDVYKFVGQHDNSYCSVEFFPGTTAHKKYGESVHGLVWYKKKDREELDITITNANYQRTNGIIYLDSGSQDKSLNHVLQYEGFEANDIKTLYRVGGEKPKVYQQAGTKEIPNTINIKIDSNFDVVGAQQYVREGYIKMGYSLPSHDLVIYYRNLLLFYPHKIKEDEKFQYLYNQDKSAFTEEADYLIHDIKVYEKIATEEEIKHWGDLLKVRSEKRMGYIKQHLGISSKVIDNMILNDTKKYITLLQSTWMFETETLVYLGPNACIYWVFERFIHIFLRHNPDFFVAASTKGQGTHFQYSFKDISRVAKIVLEQLRDNINLKLNLGKPFVVNGHYYNGNHYRIRVDPDGRLMQFHPLD
ncbi:MAG: hypothetical protein ABIU77_14360 [Ferruginibacter sp.]